MKEYIAETGGRYTYSDDILNLQELAQSMTAVFTECSAFIVSGCHEEEGGISPGYVWLGGKVRYFEGVSGQSYPYYIYEKNSNESVVYANDMNKRGRICYQCAGGNSVPQAADPLTGQMPLFLEITKDYAPRLLDKFFGRYALLLDSPSQKQRVKKDVSFAGEVSADKTLKSLKEVSVQSVSGYGLRGKVKDNGNVTVGAYLNDLLTSEITLNTDGSFSFISGGSELAKIDSGGFICIHADLPSVKVGAVTISHNHIANCTDDTDSGSVNINHFGYNCETTRFRNFNVWDGKRCSVPLFQVEGKTKTSFVNGVFRVNGKDACCVLRNPSFTKTESGLTGFLEWQDRYGIALARLGYLSASGNNLTLNNILGNVTIEGIGGVNLNGEVKLKGADIYSIFVTHKDFINEMSEKVSVVSGKQLSTEDFTAAHKKKLEAISTAKIGSGGDGYVTAGDVADTLKSKLGTANNLNDLTDKGAARTNLSVYSKNEADGRFLTVSGKLAELINPTAEETNGMTPEQISARKAEKQAEIRSNLDAEKRGTGEMKLAKEANLSDLTDKTQARKNISVYSALEVDKLLENKLGTDDAYAGVVFTEAMEQKLDGIKTGNFSYIDKDGVSYVQTEGYVLVSDIKRELTKKADRLMTGYSLSEKEAVAANLGYYTKTVSDIRFAKIESLFQDYIVYLVSTGVSTGRAHEMLREQLEVFSKKQIVDNYVRKDANLSDFKLPDIASKRTACRNLGAAYADDYQFKLTDTGWLQMGNAVTGTDTRELFIRQIGHIVSIQGIINTGNHYGSNMGGVVAVIPNRISPPKHGLRCSHMGFNEIYRYSRGAWFVISGNSREVKIYESGYSGVRIEINFTYFT